MYCVCVYAQSEHEELAASNRNEISTLRTDLLTARRENQECAVQRTQAQNAASTCENQLLLPPPPTKPTVTSPTAANRSIAIEVRNLRTS